MSPREQEPQPVPAAAGTLAGSESSKGTSSGWAVLAGLTLVTFLLLLDDTAVSVALPSIQKQIGLGLGGLEWVVNSYTLVMAAFTLLAGRLADRHGAPRIFLAGLAIFIVGSFISGLAPNAAVLIGSRSLQGLGAALVAPAGYVH